MTISASAAKSIEDTLRAPVMLILMSHLSERGMQSIGLIDGRRFSKSNHHVDHGKYTFGDVTFKEKWNAIFGIDR